jgi:hypothetical protein
MRPVQTLYYIIHKDKEKKYLRFESRRTEEQIVKILNDTISGCHGSEYEDGRLLGCCAV